MKDIPKDIQDDLHNRFTYHAPDEDKVAIHSLLRAWHKDLADIIVQHCPESWDRAQALTKLEESLMWSNAAVARNPAIVSREDIEGTPG